MTTTSATSPTTPMTRALSRSGALIAAGLAIEAISFVWTHPTSFLLFAFIGVALVGLGIVAFLWALARHS